MPLTMRPTGLGAGIDKDRQDFTIYSGGWDGAGFYETRGGPDHLRWFWSFTVTCPMTRSDRVSTMEEAKAQLADEARELREWPGPKNDSMRIVDYGGCRRNLRVDIRSTLNERLLELGLGQFAMKSRSHLSESALRSAAIYSRRLVSPTRLRLHLGVGPLRCACT